MFTAMTIHTVFLPSFPPPLFPLGQVVATPNAIDALRTNNQSVFTFINRHQSGDWSEMSEDDQHANRDSVAGDTRILSSFAMLGGDRIWVLTEADRSATTVLLPEEY